MEIYGDKEHADEINDLIKQYVKLFTNNGKIITIPKDN